MVANIAAHPDRNGVLVYDLRHDPTEFLSMTPPQLADRWKYDKESQAPRLPVKAVQFNRCPAIAPLSVLDDESKKRLNIDLKQTYKHLKLIQDSPDFIKNVLEAIGIINSGRNQQQALVSTDIDVDTQLYSAFIPDKDRNLSEKLRNSRPEDVDDFKDKFSDKRLQLLTPIYKARNFPKSLTDEERAYWEDFRTRVLLSGKEDSIFAKFMKRLEEV